MQTLQHRKKPGNKERKGGAWKNITKKRACTFVNK
jgi:hypothetical protein